MNKKRNGNGLLVGLGLDNQDGHKRLTQAEQFFIVGGSEETHEKLTETAIKTVEELRTRGKDLSTVEAAELADILHKSKPGD